MNVKNIPVIAYFGTETSYQLALTIAADTDLYDRLMAWDEDHLTYEFPGDTSTSIVACTDNLFQTNVLSPNLKYYCSKIPSYDNVIYQHGIDIFKSLTHIFNIIYSEVNVSNIACSALYGLNNDPITVNSSLDMLGYTYWVYNSALSYSLNQYLQGPLYLTPNFRFDIDYGGSEVFGRMTIPVYPQDLFDENGDINEDLPNVNPAIQITAIITNIDPINRTFVIDHYDVEILKNNNTLGSFKAKFSDFNEEHSGTTDDDSANPYRGGGYSSIGGGDGTLVPGALDSIDPAEIPDLPTLGATNLGFMTMYNPTAAQLKSLSDFMWSGIFDLDTYKKLFSDPMESIIGLAILPVSPSLGGSKNVMFGTIDSGVSMRVLSSQYVQVDCGSVNIEKFIGSFLDSDPYTKISIYLPYVGIRQLSADDIMGGSIQVVYNIDCLTGACGCFIKHSSRGVLYSYNGSCITNVPLTASNFSGAIQNAVSAVISGIGVAAGMATGAAPITAMGVTGLLNSAANTAMNSKPIIQRSGNLGGSAGIMSIQKPFVIIERPAYSVPENVEQYVGQTSNITATLGDCKGFTMCEYIHMQGCWGTENELKEIEALLKEGVII